MRRIVIVGAPGTGKSTVARALAAELGIYTVLGTDTIREILRGCYPKETHPLLHSSAILETGPEGGIAGELWGFREQAKLVLPGIQAVLKRAAKESADVVIEGIHVLPGSLALQGVVHVVLTVTDRERHLAQLTGQGQERATYKIEHFERARAFQDFLIHEAARVGLPCVENSSVAAAVEDLGHLV